MYIKRKIHFIYFSVPLVTQQSSYIEKHTSLQVGKYYGEMGVDFWSADRWSTEFNDHNILVMTRQIFLDALVHGFVHIAKINLIVFDECHHAVKNDPYVRIMKEFYYQCPPHNRPHILGLSASIVSGKCKPGDLEGKLRDLEKTLHCRIETAADLTEVAKYATNPDELLHCYDPQPVSSDAVRLKKEIDDLLSFLDYSTSRKEKEKKTRIDKDVRGIVEEFSAVLEGISLSSAIEAAEYAEVELREVLGGNLSQWERGLVAAALTRITILIQECQAILRDGGDDHSPKLTALLEIISQAVYGSNNELCGIIFVQKRSTAVCLSNIINRLSSYYFPLVRCDYVVGHGAIQNKMGSNQGGGTNMNVKKQQLVLKRFRDKRVNLLVATSVVEEGLDVRRCNLVVRYDFPQTFQSYVQSKGRARSSNSKYLLLVNKEGYYSCRMKLEEYRQIEMELQAVCHGRRVPGDDEIEEQLKRRYPPFMPFGEGRGPRLTVEGSLSLLHKLVNS